MIDLGINLRLMWRLEWEENVLYESIITTIDIISACNVSVFQHLYLYRLQEDSINI